MNDISQLPISQLPRGNHPRSSSPFAAALIVLAAAHVAGCQRIDDLPIEHLGNTQDELPVGAPPAGSSPFEGQWLGHAEFPAYRSADGQPAVYTFPSGSRDFGLDLAFEDGVFAGGSIIFGAGTVPEPESGVAYPPGFEQLPSLGYRPTPLEGFAYRLTDVTDSSFPVDPGEMRFQYELFEPHATWCPLQPSTLVEADYYNCTGAGGASGAVSENDGPPVCSQTLADGTTEPVDCGLVTLCLSDACQCEAQGCSYNPQPMVGQIFIERDGSELLAILPDTVVEITGRLETVRFQRVAAP
jgi:hypothetical protein